MQGLSELFSGARFVFGGLTFAVALSLVLALFALMPPGQRRLARFPALLLVLHLGLVLVVAVLRPAAELARGLEVAAFFLLFAALGRAGFLLGIDWFLGHRLQQPLPRIVRDVVQVFVYFGVAFLTLRQLGVELGSLLTTSALLTAVIGLSLQETLGNLFAGLAIQAQQPFRIGQWICLEGMNENTTGQVTEINWRATKIVTNDQIELTIPNGMIAKSPIRNYSEPSPVSRRRVQVRGPYDVPPHRVEAALLEAAHDCPGVLAEPAPMTWVSAYAESGIEYSLVYFIDEFLRRDTIDSRVRRRIWYALQRAGISVPFPVRDVRTRADALGTAATASDERVARAERLLRAVYLFTSLPGPVFSRLAQAAESRLYAADEDIIHQGDEGAELFVIERGAAVVLVQHPGQEPIEVARLGAGAVVGEMSLVTGERRSATVRAAQPCECLVVSARALRPLLTEFPDLAVRLSEVLASRQAALDNVQVTERSDDRATRSGQLLERIRGFFALKTTSLGPTSRPTVTGKG